MSAIPSDWTWKDHYKGSTFASKKIKFNFDITGATINCQLKLGQGTNVIYEWKTGINITVLNILTGEIALNQINEFNPAANNYIWDLQIKFANGTSQTYIKGTQKVIQDITYTL